jgi:hypothetical protein
MGIAFPSRSIYIENISALTDGQAANMQVFDPESSDQPEA